MGLPDRPCVFGPTQHFFSHSDQKNQIGKAKKTTVDCCKRQKEQGNSSTAFAGRSMTLTVIFDQYIIHKVLLPKQKISLKQNKK